MVAYMFALLASGYAIGPAVYNAFPVWRLFVDAMETLALNNPAFIEGCIRLCDTLNSPITDTLFEAIFS